MENSQNEEAHPQGWNYNNEGSNLDSQQKKRKHPEKEGDAANSKVY